MANEMTTVDALQSLKPGAEWVLRGDELEWLDSKQTEPTADELAAEVTRLQVSMMVTHTKEQGQQPMQKSRSS